MFTFLINVVEQVCKMYIIIQKYAFNMYFQSNMKKKINYKIINM